ncbi:hypothetical protein ES705_12043 [subsurface metagenome]
MERPARVWKTCLPTVVCEGGARSVEEWRLKLRLRAKEQKGVSRTKLRFVIMLKIDKLVAVAGGSGKSAVCRCGGGARSKEMEQVVWSKELRLR